MRPLILILLAAALLVPQGASASKRRAENSDFLEWMSKKHYRQGMADARRELARGKLAYESFGSLLINYEEHGEILSKKYGIERRTVGFCTPDDATISHAAGFNKVMLPAIERRYGKNIFRKASKEAVMLWRQRNPGKEDGVDLSKL